MKELLLLLLFLPAVLCFSQNEDAARLAELKQEVKTLADAGQYEACLARLDEYLTISPNDEQALGTRIAINALAMDNVEHVLKDVEAMAGLHEKPEEVYADIGFLLVDNGKLAASLTYTEASLKKFPDSPKLYCIRGKALRKMMRTDEAATAFDMAISKDPASDYTWRLAYELHESTGIEDAVVAVLDGWEKALPKSHFLHDKYSNFYKGRGEWAAALNSNDRAIEYARGKQKLLASYYMKRALIYSESGNPDKTCEWSKKARKVGFKKSAEMLMIHCRDELWVEEGTRLEYAVDYYSMKYDFHPIIRRFSDQGIEVDWSMTISPDMKGSFAITDSALQSAIDQHNIFKPGQQMVLDDKTSIWVSKAVYHTLREGTALRMSTGNGPKTFRMLGHEKFTVHLGDAGEKKAVQVMVVQSDDKEETLWIADNPDNPMIVKMDIGWSIELKRIN